MGHDHHVIEVDVANLPQPSHKAHRCHIRSRKGHPTRRAARRALEPHMRPLLILRGRKPPSNTRNTPHWPTVAVSHHNLCLKSADKDERERVNAMSIDDSNAYTRKRCLVKGTES